tara:strand:- start:1733 stop:1927 length:195 start_codon:yes stop_codon:yes gene_type:complete
MLNQELIEIHLNNNDLNLGNLAAIAKISVNEARVIFEHHYNNNDLLEYPYYQLEKKTICEEVTQ